MEFAHRPEADENLHIHRSTGSSSEGDGFAIRPEGVDQTLITPGSPREHQSFAGGEASRPFAPEQAESYALERAEKAAILADSMERGREFMGRVGYLNDGHGVNGARVTAFMGALGLELPGWSLTLNDEDVPRVQAVLRDMGLQYDHGRSEGAYSNATRTAIIYRRDRPAPAVELTKVHELAGHGSTLAGDVSDNSSLKVHAEAHKSVIPVRPRSGFCDKAWGLGGAIRGGFIEEGFARWLDQQYAWAANIIPRPHKHEWAFGRRMYAHPYDPGMVALSALFTADPTIVPAVLESRRDPAAMERVITSVNKLKPGLFEQMMDVPDYNPRSLDADIRAHGRAAEMVLSACGFTQKDADYVVNYGAGTTYVQQILDTHATSHEWYAEALPRHYYRG